MIELMQLIGAILIWAFLWSKETKTQEYLMVFLYYYLMLLLIFSITVSKVRNNWHDIEFNVSK